MNRLVPKLSRLLSERELNRIHELALRVVSEIGIKVADRSLPARFAKYAGVTQRGDRLCLSPTLVNRHLGEYRSRPKSRRQEGDRPIRLRAYDYARYIVDLARM